MSITIKAWIDGVAKGNHLGGGGEAAAGIVIGGDIRHNTLSYKIKEQLTNNEAEYAALLLCARYLKLVASRGNDILIFSDSMLLVNQMNRVWGTKDKKLVPVQEEVRSLLDGFDVYYIWVSRDKVEEADALANKAIKEGVVLCSVSPFFGDD